MMCPDEKKFKAGYKTPCVDLCAQNIVNQIQMLLPLQRGDFAPPKTTWYIQSTSQWELWVP